MNISPRKKLVLGVLIAAALIAAWSLGVFPQSNPPTSEPTPSPTQTPSGDLNHLTLPSEISISVFSKELENPRVIVFDPAGKMLVSETKAGRVVVLEDSDRDGVADKNNVVIENLRSPHGLAFYSKDKTTYLYIAETHRVVRYVYDVKNSSISNLNGFVIASLPADGRHFTRTIAFGPNYRTQQIIQGPNKVDTLAKDKLYISVGSSCDVCVEDTWKRAAILESDPEGTYTAEFAGGLRNSVFFTFHPDTKEIWATEMGRDNLGDNLPPDEINIVRAATAEHKYGARRYGWPFCYGRQIKDTKFKPGDSQRIDIPTDCSQTESPVIEIPAHSAPLGLAFISNQSWPAQWKNNLLVAFHGSWNKSEPTGYKIVRYVVDKEGRLSQTQNFISGWLKDGKVLGRPADLKFGPDGSLYISDDLNGMIYRVTPKK